LKVENVQDRHRSTGRLFQARGPRMAALVQNHEYL